MRVHTYLLVASFVLLSAIVPPASISSEEYTSLKNPYDCLGEYGCWHKELHALGIIADIIARKKELHGYDEECCDDVGECRLTVMKNDFLFLNGVWCPIGKTKKKEIVAVNNPWNLTVVCAGRASKNTCPTIWCIGAPTLM